MSVSTARTVSDILKIFKQAYVEFIDELVDQFPNESDMVILRVVFANNLPSDTVMNMFILHVLPHKDLIYKKDEAYFLEHDDIFQAINTQANKISHFKQLWQSEEMTEETKETIWMWFKHFIIIVEKYQQLVDNLKKSN